MQRQKLETFNAGTGAYAASAEIALEHGCVPVPCGGVNGKRPSIPGWNNWNLREARNKLPKLQEKFQTANLGLSCGASGFVVVDIDDPSLVDRMLEMFGTTPLLVTTPSGGTHAYYDNRLAQIGCQNLRTSHGLDVDIKGIGGLIIAPPSISPERGKSYEFASSDWSQFNALPAFNPASLASKGSPNRLKKLHGSSSKTTGRNDSLFRFLLRQARQCASFEALLDAARTKNENCFDSPLPDQEVIETATSAWRYQSEGRNWIGTDSRIVLKPEILNHFSSHKKGGDALILWCHLQARHAARSEAFAIDREAMAAKNVLPGWSSWRYRIAIDALMELRVLKRITKLRRRENLKFAPHRYIFRSLERFRQDITGTGWGGRQA